MRNIGDPNVRNLLLEVKNAGERAGKLTRQLLAFARKQVLEPKNINLNDVITEVEKFLRRVIGEHIELRFIKEDNLATVHADITQVEQVLMNLCVNARDAMPQGGILLIETHNVTFDRSYCQHHPWAKPGDYVLLSVTDTGIGMDRATQERIFEPFFTTKQLGKGTGLGLAMIYGIVKQHDGLIQVYSEVGHGTTFKIYLPAVTAFAESVKRAPVEKELSGQETILVAEDEPPLRSLIAIALQSEGYKVIMATNGEEATRLFNENETAIDLVLSDAVMPKMGGQELYEILYTRKPSLKFIFMSGYSVNAMNEKFIINEHLDLLPKPFDPVALLSKIREVLNRNN
jgi:CheY-like chemotaxis protein